jgi:hypothetical protein
MDAVAGNRRAAIASWQGGILQIQRVTYSRDAPACVRARGYTPRNRGAVEFGKQRITVPKRIGLVRIGLRPKASALYEPGDTAVNPIRHAGQFGIAGRGHMPENDFALIVDDIDAVQGHYVWFRTMSCDVGVDWF